MFLRSCFVLGGLGGDLAAFRGWFRARNHVLSNRDSYAILYIWKNDLKRLPINEFWRSKRLKSMFLRSCFVLGGLGCDLAAFRGWFGPWKRNRPDLLHGHSSVEYTPIEEGQNEDFFDFFWQFPNQHIKMNGKMPMEGEFLNFLHIGPP